MKLVDHRSSINLRWWEEIKIMGLWEILGGRKFGSTKDNWAGADMKVGQYRDRLADLKFGHYRCLDY
jgi:hypothetical protein